MCKTMTVCVCACVCTRVCACMCVCTYVSIAGERLEHCGFIEAKEFCVMVQDFLSRHALPIRGLECEAESQLVARSSANCAKADLSRSHHRAKVSTILYSKVLYKYTAYVYFRPGVGALAQ